MAKKKTNPLPKSNRADLRAYAIDREITALVAGLTDSEYVEVMEEIADRCTPRVNAMR